MRCKGALVGFWTMTIASPKPRFRSVRRAALVAVVASSVALTQSTVAVAQSAPVSRIVLGIGADETEANVAWQSRTSGPQYLEYWPSDNPGSVTTVAATQARTTLPCSTRRKPP